MSKFAGRLRVVWAAGGLLGVCVSALAQVPESVTPPAAPDVLVPMPSKADVPLHTVLPATQAEAGRAMSVDDAQLMRNPALFSQVLNQAVDQQMWDMVAHLIPLYAQVSPRDETLLSFARARLAHARGQYVQAIDAYRAILADKPTLTPIRLYLAQALFENQQNEAAVFQFEKIRADQPPAEVVQTVEQYLTAIRRRNAWRVDGWLNYLNDNNVNNAPSEREIRVNGVKQAWVLTPDSLPKKRRVWAMA